MLREGMMMRLYDDGLRVLMMMQRRERNDVRGVKKWPF